MTLIWSPTREISWPPQNRWNSRLSWSSGGRMRRTSSGIELLRGDVGKRVHEHGDEPGTGRRRLAAQRSACVLRSQRAEPLLELGQLIGRQEHLGVVEGRGALPSHGLLRLHL